MKIFVVHFLIGEFGILKCTVLYVQIVVITKVFEIVITKNNSERIKYILHDLEIFVK